MTEIKQVPLEELTPFPGNPRRGDVDAIAASLEANGQYKPIVVRQETAEILVGNHTFQAAEKLGWEKIDVLYRSVPGDEQARRIVLADNRIADLGGYENADLASLLDGLDDYAGTGYTETDVSQILDSVREAPEDPEEVPDPPAKPTTREGDLIELGEHRLLCASSAEAKSIERVLDGGRAAAVWTDPPYGVAYEGVKLKREAIANDGDIEQAAALTRDVLKNALECVSAGAPLYCAGPSGSQMILFGLAVGESGWRLRQVLVWDKGHIVLGHSDYHYRHESLFFAYAPGGGRRGRGGKGWYGPNNAPSILEHPGPRASKLHPTMKPLSLIEDCLRNSTRRNAVVLDPFAGSGSTLIACQRMERRCAAIEVDPAYCDVIVERWETATGDKAKRPRRLRSVK